MNEPNGGAPSAANEDEEMRFSVPIAPTGKGRPRFSATKIVPRDGSRAFTKVHVHSPAKTMKAEGTISFVAKREMRKNDWSAFVDAVKVEIEAVHKYRKSWTRKTRDAAREGRLACTVKPDIDNIVKLVLDALNGVAFVDDKQVVSVTASKRYGEQDEIKIIIKKEKE